MTISNTKTQSVVDRYSLEELIGATFNSGKFLPQTVLLSEILEEFQNKLTEHAEEICIHNDNISILQAVWDMFDLLLKLVATFPDADINDAFVRMYMGKEYNDYTKEDRIAVNVVSNIIGHLQTENPEGSRRILAQSGLLTLLKEEDYNG